MSRAVQPLAARSREEEAVGRAKRAAHARVERADERLGRAPELSEPRPVVVRVAVGCRAVGLGRERHGGELGREEAALLVRARTECRDRRAASVTTEATGSRRPPRYARGRRPDERARGRDGLVARDREPRASAAPRPSRTTTAIALCASGDSARSAAAPAPPNAPASVDTSTSVCSGRGSGPISCGANPRASSMSSGGSGRVLSERLLRLLRCRDEQRRRSSPRSGRERR